MKNLIAIMFAGLFTSVTYAHDGYTLTELPLICYKNDKDFTADLKVDFSNSSAVLNKVILTSDPANPAQVIRISDSKSKVTVTVLRINSRFCVLHSENNDTAIRGSSK